MRDERARILELLQEGKIGVDEAEQLLDALGDVRAASGDDGTASTRNRRLCIRITDLRTGKVKTNVRLPFGAWGLLSKLTRTRIGLHIGGLALHDIQRAARGGSNSRIIELSDDDKGERVEIFFE